MPSRKLTPKRIAYATADKRRGLMDKIIRAEWEKNVENKYGIKSNWHYYKQGWKACEQWHERQAMLDRDSLEQTREEAQLAEGR